MENIDKKIKDAFKHINETTGNSSDIVTRIIKIGQKKVGYVYLESVSSDDKISDFLVRGLSWDAKTTNFNFFNLDLFLLKLISRSAINTICILTLQLFGKKTAGLSNFNPALFFSSVQLRTHSIYLFQRV